MSDDLVAILNKGADGNAMVARVLRHAEDRPVCPRPEDFWVALKYDPAVVVRLRAGLPGGFVLPVDCRHRDGDLEFTHEHRDLGCATRDRFIDDVRQAIEVEVLHHRDSQFGDPWTCANCGAESIDPESERVASRNVVRVTCPDCGTVDEVPQGSEPPRSSEEVA
jgi:predicted RNA-binding Zn-ribbon protein involved in translation (DUF1610 family)